MRTWSFIASMEVLDSSDLLRAVKCLTIRLRIVSRRNKDRACVLILRSFCASCRSFESFP